MNCTHGWKNADGEPAPRYECLAAEVERLQAIVHNQRTELGRLKYYAKCEAETLPCGHAKRWTAFSNPVDVNSSRICLFCEIDRLQAELSSRQAATKWEADHQQRHLQELGLADEFSFGCDAIEHVGTALLAARAEVERLRMLVLSARDAMNEYHRTKTSNSLDEVTRIAEMCNKSELLDVPYVRAVIESETEQLRRERDFYREAAEKARQR